MRNIAPFLIENWAFVLDHFLIFATGGFSVYQWYVYIKDFYENKNKITTNRTVSLIFFSIASLIGFYLVYLNKSSTVGVLCDFVHCNNCDSRERYDEAVGQGKRGVKAFLKECPRSTYARDARYEYLRILYRDGLQCINDKANFCKSEICIKEFDKEFLDSQEFSFLKKTALEADGVNKCGRDENPCLQEGHFREESALGIGGLRKFIKECDSIGGGFLAQAKADLEKRVYEKAKICIDDAKLRLCRFDSCILSYENDSLNQYNIEIINEYVKSYKKSQVCAPKAVINGGCSGGTLTFGGKIYCQ